MKKKYFIPCLLLVMVTTCKLQAQLRVQGQPNTTTIVGSSVFLDATTGNNPANYIAKGMVIPSVDLVNFEFTNHADGFTFPTYFDGMLVYNRATGTTLTTGNRSTTGVGVVPGYYFYSNPAPTGASDMAKVRSGVWKPIAEAVVGGNGVAVSNGLINVTDATTTQKGILQLSGDLGGTADAPTVPGLATKEPSIAPGLTSQYFKGDKTWSLLDKAAVGLANVDNTSDADKPISTATQMALSLKEDLANKSTSIITDAASTTKYPSVKTVKNYVDAQISLNSTLDATTAIKGKLLLAGDLAGTADAPTVPGLALKAPIDSPVLTGTPQGPTAAIGTATTQIASTEFVNNSINKKAITLKTADYTVALTDETILCNTTSAGFTLTLPAASTANGKVLVIRKVDESANTLTFSPVLKLDASGTVSSTNMNTTLTVRSNGTDWYIMGDNGGSVIFPSIVSLDCSTATNAGTLVAGVVASGVTSSISYTGGNGDSYAAQSISSSPTGVTGLTATLTAGSFATGTGSLTYTITGTPSGSGTATFAINIGGQTCSLTRTVVAGSLATINCSTATNAGTLVAGAVTSGVTSTISYTGGNGGSYAAQSINSSPTGVTGLTATLTAGSFATGTGSLTYTITGTPSGSGTATFAINIGGQTCSLTRDVTITVPASITLGQNSSYTVASIYDQNYLPYTAPTAAATTSVQNADGTNEATIVNIQGTITTTGVAIKLPVTATASGTLPAYTTTINIPPSLTEDGVSRNLTLSWASQGYTTATKTINATIAAVGGTLNVKKLDINAGVGNDALGVLLGSFSYPFNNAGSTTTCQVRAIAGIPDKMFGVADNAGSSTSHLMLYTPVYAEDGKIWLNNNLGAHYATISHASFNPNKQATSATDHLAYGSHFQWGRKPDGHELVTYTNSTIATAVNGTTTTLNNNPTHASFITTLGNDWRVNKDDTLWTTVTSPNNPCPSGFKLSSVTEFDTLIAASTITNSTTAFNSNLKFVLSGNRIANATLSEIGSSSYIWTSSINGSVAIRYFFDGTSKIYYSNSRGIGSSVRCIMN